jgi:hypothetical protein
MRTSENLSTELKKNCTTVTLPTTKHKDTILKLNPGLCSDSLSHDTNVNEKGFIK